MESRTQILELLFENYEEEHGFKALGYLLADRLDEISVRLTYQSDGSGTRIWSAV